MRDETKNITTNRQYKFYTCIAGQGKEEMYKGHDVFTLTFNRLEPPTENGFYPEATVYVDKNDFISIAEVIIRMVPEQICKSQKVRKQYFSYEAYCPGDNQTGSWQHCNTFYVEAERRKNHVVAGKDAYIYKLTLSYWDAFQKRESFVFDLRESDFIALGKFACEVLDEEHFRGFAEG